MTTLLGTHTFDVEPAIDFSIQAKLSEKQLAKAGQKRQYTGHGDLKITLTGSLEGVDCYTDRDTIITDMVKLGGKVMFYSDTISHGALGSPKYVWVEGFDCHHPEGIPNYLEFTISLVEET